MTVGEKIRAARIAAGMTQKELAYLLDVSYVNISQYENGKRNPKYSTLEKIAQELDIDPITLLPDSSVESWQSGRSYGAGESVDKILDYGYRISDDEMHLVNLYWQLNKSGKRKAIERMEELTEISRYRRQYATESMPAKDTTPTIEEEARAEVERQTQRIYEQRLAEKKAQAAASSESSMPKAGGGQTDPTAAKEA